MAYFARFGSMIPRIHHHLYRLLGLCLFFGLLCPLAKGEITKAFRPRIVGGEDAQRGEFPWLVSLQGPWSCGASLIGDEWILTAAHCVVDDLNQVMPAEDFELAIGALYLSEVTQTHPIEQIIVHPGYDPTTMENDIALLRLTQPYDLTYPRLALNQDPSIPQPGDLATVAGWGALASEGASSDRMQKVSVPIVSLAQANDPKAYGGDILPSMLAAGFIQGGKDSCQGDSGGPLVVEVQGKSIQVGVVSWGKGCAEPYAYGIYTRVAAFIDWVEAITGLSGSAPTDRELIITRSPQSWSGNLGQTAHFSVLADGEPPLTYQWLFNGQELEGAQGASLVIPQVGLEHQGLYSVWVSAGNQQMLSQEVSLDLLQRIDLGEALDQPQWVFDTEADPMGWFGIADASPEQSFDQADTAHSGAIEDMEVSTLSTQLTGPGILSFQWKVSSEADYDWLTCWVGGQQAVRISGQQPWQEVRIPLPEGEQQIQWTYRKDENLSEGLDTAWLDQVRFDGISKPVIQAQPESVLISSGEAVTFSVQASGKAPLSYQWFFQGEPIEGAHLATLHIPAASQVHVGAYHVQVTAAQDTVTSSAAMLSLLQTSNLAEALDQSLASLETDPGPHGWYGQSQWSSDGVDAAQSGEIADGQSSEFSLSIEGPSTIGFQWRVSSEEDYDWLECWVDNDLIMAISGEVDWTQERVILTEGSHVMRWVYRKDVSESYGQDAGWVDQLTVTASQELILFEQPQSVRSILGAEVTFRVGAVGLPPLAYQWFFNGEPISGAQEPTLTLSALRAEQEGDYSVRVVSLASSQTVMSDLAELRLEPELDLAQALDQTEWTFLQLNQQDGWQGQTRWTHDQVDAAQSPPLGDQSSAGFSTTLQGPGLLRFYWKVSSESDWDWLVCQVGDLAVRQISGEVGWHETEVMIPAGIHTVSWIYRKDEWLSEGMDAGWVDEIAYTPIEELPGPVLIESWDSEQEAAHWWVNRFDDEQGIDEIWTGDAFWREDQQRGKGLAMNLSGEHYLIYPAEDHPQLSQFLGDYLERDYRSISWDMYLTGDLDQLGVMSLSLYREDEDTFQIAYLDLFPVVLPEGMVRYTAFLDDPGWVLWDETSPWDVEDVMHQVTDLSLEFYSQGADWGTAVILLDQLMIERTTGESNEPSAPQGQLAQIPAFEDFETLVLGPSLDEELAGESVWTKLTPSGWTIDDQGVPGVGNPDLDGVTEWAGWSFADKGWWSDTAGDQGRSEFVRASGTVAIADGDEWDDQPHASGYLNTFLIWSLDVSQVNQPLELQFDSSWRPEYDDNYHQRANITVSFDEGPVREVLRWESDENSADFHDDQTNERVVVPLPNPRGASVMSVSFGYMDAGNDWWWALDNLQIIPIGGSVLNYTLEGSQLSLSWESGILERTDSLHGGWVAMEDASSPHVVNVSQGQAFYRIRSQ